MNNMTRKSVLSKVCLQHWLDDSTCCFLYARMKKHFSTFYFFRHLNSFSFFLKIFRCPFYLLCQKRKTFEKFSENNIKIFPLMYEFADEMKSIERFMFWTCVRANWSWSKLSCKSYLSQTQFLSSLPLHASLKRKINEWRATSERWKFCEHELKHVVEIDTTNNKRIINRTCMVLLN